MPRKKQIDTEKLYEMIKAGVHSGEIMSKFGFATKQQLKSVVLDLSIEKNEVLKLVGSHGRTTGNRRINKTGMIISKTQLVPPFEQGDEFIMNIEGDKITLTKVD